MMPLPQYFGNNTLIRLLRMKKFMCKINSMLKHLEIARENGC